MGAVHKGGDGGGRLTFSTSAGAPQWLRSTDIYESAEVRTPEVSRDGRGGTSKAHLCRSDPDSKTAK